jgi:hypothetical protein
MPAILTCRTKCPLNYISLNKYTLSEKFLPLNVTDVALRNRLNLLPSFPNSKSPRIEL